MYVWDELTQTLLNAYVVMGIVCFDPLSYVITGPERQHHAIRSIIVMHMSHAYVLYRQ